MDCPLGAVAGATNVINNAYEMDAEVLNMCLDLEEDKQKLTPLVCNVSRVENYASSEDNKFNSFPFNSEFFG